MGSPEGLPYGGYRICGYSVGTGEENRSRQEGYAHCQLKIGTEAQGCGGGRKAEDVPDHLLAHLSPLARFMHCFDELAPAVGALRVMALNFARLRTRSVGADLESDCGAEEVCGLTGRV